MKGGKNQITYQASCVQVCTSHQYKFRICNVRRTVREIVKKNLTLLNDGQIIIFFSPLTGKCQTFAELIENGN